MTYNLLAFTPADEIIEVDDLTDTNVAVTLVETGTDDPATIIGVSYNENEFRGLQIHFTGKTLYFVGRLFAWDRPIKVMLADESLISINNIEDELPAGYLTITNYTGVQEAVKEINYTIQCSGNTLNGIVRVRNNWQVANELFRRKLQESER